MNPLSILALFTFGAFCFLVGRKSKEPELRVETIYRDREPDLNWEADWHVPGAWRVSW